MTGSQQSQRHDNRRSSADNAGRIVAVILAAGKSTRMKSDVPKVLHPICGRPMIDYVLDATRAAGAGRIVVVVGYKAEGVEQALSHHPDVEFALQSEQKGTGHAVMAAEEQLAHHAGPVLILAGDMPLLTGENLAALLREQQTHGAAAVIGTAVTEAAGGLGRVVRDADGAFRKIVEEKDATPEEQAIREINTGCYAFDGPKLLDVLHQLRPENRQAEYYLTDCPALLMERGERVIASRQFDVIEAKGINTRGQLAEVGQIVQRRHVQQLMQDGVTVVNPEQTWVEPQARIGRETVVYPFSSITGPAVIGKNCRIGPHAVVEGPVEIDDGTTIEPFQRITGGCADR